MKKISENKIPNINQFPWMELTSLGGGMKSRLAVSHWPYDKYPDLPEVTPKSKTVVLDAEGPGVITMFHVSAYRGGDQEKLLLRIWYDGEAKPSIEMPYMDFLGDTESKTSYFSTIYFSHVKESHNFRLPMPFRRHIRIEVENPTDSKFTGYTEIQWEKVKELPAATGYLRVAYCTGTATIPEEIIELCKIEGAGVVVAHWLQIQADHPMARNSDLICEGNQEIYLEGSSTPQLEYLGTEDCYGYSWGMAGGIQSDHFAAVTRVEQWGKSGGLFTMLRCRGIDKISFESACRWLLNYRNEYFSTPQLTRQPKLHHQATLSMPYRSAIYYYGK